MKYENTVGGGGLMAVVVRCIARMHWYLSKPPVISFSLYYAASSYLSL